MKLTVAEIQRVANALYDVGEEATWWHFCHPDDLAMIRRAYERTEWWGWCPVFRTSKHVDRGTIARFREPVFRRFPIEY